jgi:choline dehydrogenase-like flavoprotein
VKSLESQVVIVGSGVGGAVLANELAQKGIKITILEAGKHEKLGTERRSLNFYTSGSYFSPSEKSVEGTELLRTKMVGGSSVVTLGNGIRALEQELAEQKVDLKEEFEEAEDELKIIPTPTKAMGQRTVLLMNAAEALGYSVKPMPKYIDFKKCRNCGNCQLGCIYGAKWTSLQHLGKARKAGAKLLTSTPVQEVLHTNGEITGVRTANTQGFSEITTQTVILAAGGLGTPAILQKSGIPAGNDLFADLFINTYGLVDAAQYPDELGMATIIDLHDKEGFILSPFIDTPLDMFLYLPLFQKLNSRRRHRILGLMAKTTDDAVGTVDEKGIIHKPITKDDQKRLDKGKQLSSEILIQAGADPQSIFTSPIRGAHVGGTASIGKVVNSQFETEISRLFVCDASILPKTPGKPPVLTIVALAKRLAKTLVSEYL